MWQFDSDLIYQDLINWDMLLVKKEEDIWEPVIINIFNSFSHRFLFFWLILSIITTKTLYFALLKQSTFKSNLYFTNCSALKLVCFLPQCSETETISLKAALIWNNSITTICWLSNIQKYYTIPQVLKN